MTFMLQLLLGVYANAVISFPLWLLLTSDKPERAVEQWEGSSWEMCMCCQEGWKRWVCAHVDSHTRSGLSRDFAYSSST